MTPKDKQSFLEARRQQALETTASWFHAGVEAAEDWAAMQANAQPAPDISELVEALRREFPLLNDNGLDEAEHHCEWSIQQDRKRLHATLTKYGVYP